MWKSRLLFIFCLALSFVLIAGFVASEIGYLLLYTMLIFLLLAGISVIFARLFLKIPQEDIKYTIYKNETLQYSVKLVNSGPFIYPNSKKQFYNSDIVEYFEIEPEGGAILPFGRRKISRNIKMPYRGVYEVGLKSVKVMDFLGLFSVTIKGENSVSVTVYPDYDPEFKLPIRNEPQITSLKTDYYSEEDYTSVADLRKYTPEDSLKHVHWKLSAKRNELMVKNYDLLEPNKVIIFVDTRQIPLENGEKAAIEDKIAHYCASAINYCYSIMLPTKLVFGNPAVYVEEVDFFGQPDEAFEVLAKLEFGEEKSHLDSLSVYADSGNVVLMLTEITPEDYPYIQELLSYEHKTIIYFFSSVNKPLTTEQKELLYNLESYGVIINLIS